MGNWGIYNTSLDFFNNLQIDDKLKFNKSNCIVEGIIIKIDRPIKTCKVMKITKKIDLDGCECSLCDNERIMIFPSHSNQCEVI